jgi:uncharacterized membrane protein YbaN (DUF454 family)
MESYPDALQAGEQADDAAPLREPTVVHSSYGRLRVHLPHWTGADGETIAAAVLSLPAVTHTEANPLTGNVLILFEPEHTSASALLETLPLLHLDPPAGPPASSRNGPPASSQEAVWQTTAPDWQTTVPERPLEWEGGETVTYVQGPRAVMYKALGWSSVGMAVVGAITPGIPTAPFVILAGYFFVRSSPESHRWLRRSRWFGPILRDWEAHRGVRRSIRNAAVALIGGSMVVTALLGLPTPLTVTIMALQVVGIAIVMRLRVVEPVPPPPEGDILPMSA